MLVYAGGPLRLIMETFCKTHNLSYQIKPSPGMPCNRACFLIEILKDFYFFEQATPMAWTQAMETSQGWWVDLSCFEYSCSTIQVVSNILVLQYELFRIFLSYNMSCLRWTFWRWEWYRGERWTSEEACSPSWRRERWTLNARWPKFLISKNIFTFCFFSGGGGLQQRHQCWGKYNLDENSKVILYIVLSEQLFSTASF